MFTRSDAKADSLTRLQREAEEDTDYQQIQELASRPQGALSESTAGKQLAKWRKVSTDTPHRHLTDESISSAFPAIHEVAAPSKPRVNRWEAHQVRQANSKGHYVRDTEEQGTGGKANSDMGYFNRLPGELRNVIYRYAFVPSPADQPVLLSGSDLVCGTGACVHQKLPIAAPGIASTCKQIRNELLPIFVTENGFRFDAVMVRNRCAGNWVKALNCYARMLKKVTLEVQVFERDFRRGAWRTKHRMCALVLEMPAGRADERFVVGFGELPAEKVELSGLKRKIEGLNDGLGVVGQASKLAAVLFSEELAELVFRCRK
ncbi:hypothetical protein B0A50_02238 [Salinomyces thailandicus]|uniref:Uncharacterized protein n=1 Tax=Salinomyces thailandicus TaxID=706561 RepID=A0A4U0U9N8_9PEZI|nr:hypothetical protein B0A50_02238 [Salinomyces thailandica]